MSHSAFRILSNEETINRNLVIVVNKNGQVSTDTNVLQELLTSKDVPKTGISILRESSPTSSIADEIEQERQEKYEMKRQEFLSAHEGEEIDEEELEKQMKQITGAMDDEIPHVTLTVENFYTPDQAKKFATEVLQLGGIDNPNSLKPIDFNFRRQTVQNDHCYTPLTQSPDRPNHSQSSKASGSSKASQNKSLKREHKPTPKAKQQVDEDTSDSGEAALDDDEEYEEEQSDEQEVSFSESDDDNDMDFSVNDRFGKKGRKKRKYRKHKQGSKNTFKDFLETGEVQEDEPTKKKYAKSPKKAPVQQKPSTSGKIVSLTNKNTQPPVIIKKVIQAQPTMTVTKNNLVRKEPAAQFVPLTVNFMKTQLSTQISIQSSIPPMKSKQEIEFVESMVQDLEKSFPETNKKNLLVPPIIPNIMQLMETNTSAEILDQSLSTLEQLDSADGAVGIEEIGDALIAALGNEALDELLNQNELMVFDSNQAVAPAMKPSQNLVSSSIQPIPVMAEATTSTPVVSSNIMPKILNKQAPIKDPIKVVRHGRVITLPVITAPTTRGAKRRAQGDSPNTSISLPSPTTGKMAKTEKTPSNKDPDSKNSSRRSSLNKSESGKSSRRQSTVTVQSIEVPEEFDDLNSGGSWGSEDDPDRLWCVCKQPHNNRFMICCDKCEEWFHGTCVNVTKAMGKEFETLGKEWRCPTCRADGSKKPNADPNKKPLNQQKLTKFFAKSQKGTSDDESGQTMCAVCKQKPARDSSIYCSDECIKSHATKHLDADAQSGKGSPSSLVKDNVKRGNVFKDKSGNVIVYDKTTGKILPLSQSPHLTVLGTWLSQNPNYEPIKPGSAQAEQIMSRNKTQSQQQPQQTPTSSTTSQLSPTKLPQINSGDDLFSNPVKINTGVSPTVVPKKITGQGQHSGNSGSVRSNVSVKNSSSSTGVKPSSSTLIAPPKSSNVTSTSHKTPVTKNDHKKLKSQSSEERPPSNLSSKLKVEHDRMLIRNTLRDTLQQRMKEFEHSTIPKMTADEIVDFAKETEREMFLFFNKEIKDKYKAKYRSLKFNLSDVKNKTLLEKICAQKITAKQLVELPPAALASDELAKWREHENKHQLEIITKSELDALAQNKIVVKTHKGEEIIEKKSAPVDILVPIVDDVESVIAKTVMSVEDPHGRYDLGRSISLNVSSGNASSPLSSPSITSSTGRKSDSKHRSSRSRSKSKGRDHHHHHKSSSSSKHKKSDRHRSRSPRHHSSRDKDRKKSRDRSKSKKSEDHKHHRDKSKEKEKLNSSKTKGLSKDSKNHLKVEEKPDLKLLDIEPDQQDVDLVGKILGSMGVQLDKPLLPKVKDEKPKVEVAVKPKDEVEPPAPYIEPKQLVEIYSGNLHMADVAKFNVTASIVSGNFENIPKFFPSQLEIVGRIDPNTVFGYLDKVKRLAGKELCVLRFAPTDESKTSYFEFFTYLHSKQRYGVIKSPMSKVKDFYLIPVEASKPVPKVLLPFVGPGFIEGESQKPDLFLGVILKITAEDKTKKPTATKKVTSKLSRPQFMAEMAPKHKSHNSKLTMGLPEFSKSGELQPVSTSRKSPLDTNDDDGDEPYTPFDDDDELVLPPVFKPTPSKSSNADIENEMEKITREIEQRQMEIQSLAKQKAMELNVEQATRIFENISVPHNLSEILSTISKSEAKPMELDNDDDDEYVPTASMSSMEYNASASYSAMSQAAPPIVNSMMDIDERIALFQAPTMIEDAQPSRLANMTDADLMKLVPDDAFEAPPPPNISGEQNQLAIPGLDADYEMN